MSDSLPPMTDTDLAAIEARLAAATPGPWEMYDSNEGTEYFPMWSVANDDYHNPREDGTAFGVSIECGEKADADLIANAPTDLRRLLDEVKRLNREFADFRHMAVLNSKAATGAVDRARSECAALAAKVEAARQGLAENLAEYEQMIASFKSPNTMIREEEEHRDLARAETAEARNCLAIFDAAMGSGMPHTPAQEAQERPETREGATDAGTGEREAHGRSEADGGGSQCRTP